jgi:hypothetical protein
MENSDPRVTRGKPYIFSVEWMGGENNKHFSKIAIKIINLSP